MRGSEAPPIINPTYTGKDISLKIYVGLMALFISSAFADSCPNRGVTKQVCPYSPSTLSFEGDAKTQANCLLRPVLMCGRISATITPLPSNLEQRVGTPVELERSVLRSYLVAKKIAESEVGGSLDRPVSKTCTGLHRCQRSSRDLAYPGLPRRVGFGYFWSS